MEGWCVINWSAAATVENCRPAILKSNQPILDGHKESRTSNLKKVNQINTLQNQSQSHSQQ